MAQDIIENSSPRTDQELNNSIRNWVPKVRSKLKSAARVFTDGKTSSFVMRGSRKEQKLAQSIASATKMADGAIDRVQFKFERHGVFVHKGVGRGYPIKGGGVMKNKSGKTRHPVEWFNPVFDAEVPVLADELAEIDANLAVNATRLYIR